MRISRWVLAALIVLSLVACGGGGGGTTYEVSATAGPGGTISPSRQFVNSGTSANLIVTPENGFGIESVTGCGGNLVGNTYTTGPITAACPVRATFNQLRPTVPSLSLTPRAIKTFGFTWTDVSFETEYRLLENPDGMSGYTVVDEIDAGSVSFDLKNVFLPQRINASYILQACNQVGCTDSAPVFVSTSLAEAVGYFKASAPADEAFFGSSVAVSDDGRTLVIGAPLDDVNGAVYIFERGVDGPWIATERIPSACLSCQFGHTVSFAAGRRVLVVGAPSATVPGPGNVSVQAGAVYIYFVRSSQDPQEPRWQQTAAIHAPVPIEGMEFGYSVALTEDGVTLAVGAPGSPVDFNNPNLNRDGGSAYVFLENPNIFGESWVLQLKARDLFPTAGGDRLGEALALSGDGNLLAIGAPEALVGSAGLVLVAERTAQLGWQIKGLGLLGSLIPRAGQNFGAALAFSQDGSTLAVGAPGDSSAATGIGGNQDDVNAADSGAVYLYAAEDLPDFTRPLAYIKASNSREDFRFGTSVALSGDGNTLVVGAPGETSIERGITTLAQFFPSFASDAGAVYLFAQGAEGLWRESAYVKASNTHSNSFFGVSVAIDSAASTVAIGAPGERSNAAGLTGNDDRMLQEDRSLEFGGAVYLY